MWLDRFGMWDLPTVFELGNMEVEWKKAEIIFTFVFEKNNQPISF